DKKEFVAGESTKETVKTIARGKPSDFRRTRGDYRVLLPMHTGRGCSGHPAFPAPSDFKGREVSSQTRADGAARSRSHVDDDVLFENWFRRVGIATCPP